MLEKNIRVRVLVFSLHILFLGWRHNIRMHAGKIPIGIEFRNHRAGGRQEHHLDGIFPLSRQQLGQLITLCRPLLHVVNDRGRADEVVIETVNYLWIGEQTCSQVGTAGSAALIFKRPPRNDGEDRPAATSR